MLMLKFKFGISFIIVTLHITTTIKFFGEVEEPNAFVTFRIRNQEIKVIKAKSNSHEMRPENKFFRIKLKEFRLN